MRAPLGFQYRRQPAFVEEMNAMHAAVPSRDRRGVTTHVLHNLGDVPMTLRPVSDRIGADVGALAQPWQPMSARYPGKHRVTNIY